MGAGVLLESIVMQDTPTTLHPQSAVRTPPHIIIQGDILFLTPRVAIKLALMRTRAGINILDTSNSIQNLRFC